MQRPINWKTNDYHSKFSEFVAPLAEHFSIFSASKQNYAYGQMSDSNQIFSLFIERNLPEKIRLQFALGSLVCLCRPY